MFFCSNMMKKFVFHCLRFVQVAKYKTIFKFGRMFFSIQTILISKYIKEILRFFFRNAIHSDHSTTIIQYFFIFQMFADLCFLECTSTVILSSETLHFKIPHESRSDLCFISICDINHLLLLAIQLYKMCKLRLVESNSN